MSDQETTEADEGDDGPAGEPLLDLPTFYDVLEERGRPVVTAREVADAVGCSPAAAEDALADLAGGGHVERQDVQSDPVVWYPGDYRDTADRERVVVFPRRREVVVDGPDQVTRARLAQFAHLVEHNHDGGYVYEVREEDVWNVPFDDRAALLDAVRTALGGRHEELETFVERQWERAHRFRLVTHEEGYVVLAAESADLMGNVARQTLDEELRGPISDTESWVDRDATAAVKRRLYDAGYPVQDHRDLETGEDLPVELSLSLRDYQRDWRDRFLERGSGVLVGPPGSGKTVAAMGVMAAVEGETLVLVPSRELVQQWRKALLADTSLTADQVGEYHGGRKEIRPVTLATYRTAGMERHRSLFSERRWGLVVYDECQTVPAPVASRTADLQTAHRLGLSGSPVREDDKQREIFTLVGPPIGTDWAALFDAGYVAEPEVEIRYVPWASDLHRDEYAAADGHRRRQRAAENPAKVEEVKEILAEHADAKALVFVEYLDQGDALADALSVPFVSGETPHARRQRLFEQFRSGRRDVLVVSRVGDEGLDLPDAEVAVEASGLGGSRRQGTQRAGRTMRPSGRARMYVLATRGTEEEDFARRRLRHLGARGVSISERDAVAWADDAG